jgi:ribonuclease-3 family protein
MPELDQIREQFGCGERDIRTYSPLTLAYIGDGVFEMIIRTVVVCRADRSAKQLHRTTIKYVSAVSQSKIYDVLAAGETTDGDSAEDQAEGTRTGTPILTDEELAVMKRGRNAGPAATSRNATAAEYRKATGLEALMGYLYLTGQTDRAVELARIGLERAGLEL